MSYYGEYTTVYDVRNIYENSPSTSQDPMLLDLIRSTSDEIDQISGRQFVPRIETQFYDAPNWADVRPATQYGGNYLNVQGGAVETPIRFSDDLLEVVTLLNGDGSTIPSSKYFLFPNNFYPKQTLQLKGTGGIAWLPTSAGEYIQAISLTAVFGYHENYANAWRDVGASLAAAIVSTSATTFTCTTGLLQVGHFIKIDSEYMYVTAVTVGGSDTVTVVRGVNGSTAATHLIATAIYRWWNRAIEMLCRQAVVAYHRLKNNPTGETIRVGNDSFSTPKDVYAWMDKRLQTLSVEKLVVG